MSKLTKYRYPTPKRFGTGYEIRSCAECGQSVAAVKDAAGNTFICDERTAPPQSKYHPSTHTLHAKLCRKK